MVKIAKKNIPKTTSLSSFSLGKPLFLFKNKEIDRLSSTKTHPYTYNTTIEKQKQKINKKERQRKKE